MTTIGSQMSMMSVSPRAMMDKRIDAAVSAGSISATDETALETALDSIDAALGVGGSSASSGSSARLSPSDMKDRVDSLIQDQVDAGTLTAEQAEKLQGLFAQGGPQGVQGSESTDGTEISGVEGARGPGGPKGPPPGPPPSGSSGSDDDDDDDTTSDTTDQLSALISFLENLRSSLQQGYGASTTSSDSSNSGLVVDTLA